MWRASSPGKKELIHMTMPSSFYFGARHQISLCHVFSQDFPQYPHELHTLTTALFRGGKGDQRGVVTFPKYISRTGKPYPLCCVWGGHSPVELLTQDLLGCSEHLVDKENDWVVWEAFSWKDGYRDCSKLPNLPSLSPSMVQASPRDRIDNPFSHQRHKDEHCHHQNTNPGKIRV